MVEATVSFGARNHVIPFSEKGIEKLFQDSYELHFFQAFTTIKMKIRLSAGILGGLFILTNIVLLEARVYFKIAMNYISFKLSLASI